MSVFHSKSLEKLRKFEKKNVKFISENLNFYKYFVRKKKKKLRKVAKSCEKLRKVAKSCEWGCL
jgi:mRNA-degrading endonuclease RelE of RelBE toxin-antitoxin system